MPETVTGGLEVTARPPPEFPAFRRSSILQLNNRIANDRPLSHAPRPTATASTFAAAIVILRASAAMIITSAWAINFIKCIIDYIDQVRGRCNALIFPLKYYYVAEYELYSSRALSRRASYKYKS